ncbi:membrane protein implicated in regulation of membrane protease activity [Bradyrhizobium sp. LM3.4]
MSDTLAASLPTPRRLGADAFFAGGIVAMLTILFLPIPPILIDLGLAFSIALSALILMVALWIQRPLDFSAFPTVLLIATILRLALNVATTRLILSRGGEGENAAGHVVAGFSKFVMGGDFVIGLIIFAILVTVNFVVITKGATRIAEVGARFTLDAIPGKQMAIDADLSAGLIDDKEAQRRRRELEEESAFFGAMDGASKFVRGDAIAGLIITAINIFGGIIIGVTHHGLTLSRAADVYTKLSVGDGLVTQMPATDRVAIGGPAGLQGRHQGVGGAGSVAPARRLSARGVGRRADDVRACLDAGVADGALLAARRRHGLRRILAAEAAGGPEAEGRCAQSRRTRPGRGQGIGQGIAQDRGDRAGARRPPVGPSAGLAYRARTPCG